MSDRRVVPALSHGLLTPTLLASYLGPVDSADSHDRLMHPLPHGEKLAGYLLVFRIVF